MGSHPKGEPPVKRPGTNSHASKAKKATATREVCDQANLGYHAAKYYIDNSELTRFRGNFNTWASHETGVRDGRTSAAVPA